MIKIVKNKIPIVTALVLLSLGSIQVVSLPIKNIEKEIFRGGQCECAEATSCPDITGPSGRDCEDNSARCNSTKCETTTQGTCSGQEPSFNCKERNRNCPSTKYKCATSLFFDKICVSDGSAGNKCGTYTFCGSKF